MPPSLLDTDILSELVKQRNPIVRGHALRYSQQHGALIFSAVTRYEVTRGYLDQGATTQLTRFSTFCVHSRVLPLTDAIFDRAAIIWTIGRRGGHPRGDADILIAATAIEHGLALVTGNTSHFHWIPGLMIANWRLP